MLFESLTKLNNFGLLLLRLGIGVMFIMHGTPKIFGGPEVWVNLGNAMQNLGISYCPVFWGFMASLAEFGGGICLILGILFIPACFLMFFTMFVASVMHFAEGAGLMGASHAIELGIIFFSLMFIGPGKYSL